MNEKNNSSSRPSTEFTFASFLWRFAAALVLVLLSYNPSHYSYFHWIRGAISGEGLGPEHFFVGVLLLIGWSIFLFASFRALGKLGMFLGAAFFGTLVWLLTDIGVLEAESGSSITWIALVCLAGLLGIGVSWSHIWRRMTGQFEVDDSGA
jgi:hypothetical protein